MENKHFFVELNDADILGKSFEFDICDDFFLEMGGYIKKGHVNAKAVCERADDDEFSFVIHSVGNIYTPCDRCLDDVELRIDINKRLNVKLGSQDEDEGEWVIIDKNHHLLDLSHLVYQFVALSLPISRVHQPGRCNQAMMEILNQHQVARSDEETDGLPDNSTSELMEDDNSTDHRWDKLKLLLNK